MDNQTELANGSRIARLVIVDDHDLVRAGLRDMFSDQRWVEVVGEARTGREAVVLCQRLRPHLVLMDIRMPDMDGLEATRLIKAERPSTAVIIVTMHENPDYLLEALQAGAAGYVLKGSPRHDIISAVREVLSGNSLLDAHLINQLLHRLIHGRAGTEGTPVGRITTREREVLTLMVAGLTNPEIAARLSIGLGTVKTHVSRLISKLAVSDRTQAAVRAVQLGLVQPPTPG